MRKQRQSTWLVSGTVRVAGTCCRRKLAQQQLDQPVLYLYLGPAGRFHYYAAQLLLRHRPDYELAVLECCGEFGVPQGLTVEVGAQAKPHDGRAGQRG